MYTTDHTYKLCTLQVIVIIYYCRSAWVISRGVINFLVPGVSLLGPPLLPPPPPQARDQQPAVEEREKERIYMSVRVSE